MSVDYGPSGAALGFPYTPPQGGGGAAVPLAGDVTGTTAASVVSELQGEVLTVTGPLAAGEVLASDAGGTALVNADIATVLGYDPAANLGALGIPDPTGAPDGRVVTTTGGAYGLAAPSSGPALSSATPQPLGTATAGVSTEASRADHVHAPGVVTTYAFGDATGVTLENGSVGGTAAVAGGLLVLTCPATPAARHYSSYQEAPRGVIAVPAADGRAPVRWRVRARLASIDAGTVAYLNVSTAAGAARYGFYVNSDGSYGAENNVSIGSYGSGSGFPVDGTGWCEVEYDGNWAYFRIGTGVGTAEPTTWTDLARGDLGTTRPVQVRLVGAANTAPGSVSVIEWDSCTFEALP